MCTNYWYKSKTRKMNNYPRTIGPSHPTVTPICCSSQATNHGCHWFILEDYSSIKAWKIISQECLLFKIYVKQFATLLRLRLPVYKPPFLYTGYWTGNVSFVDMGQKLRQWVNHLALVPQRRVYFNQGSECAAKKAYAAIFFKEQWKVSHPCTMI